MKITQDLLTLKELEFKNRLKGYKRFYRERYLLLINKDMNIKEFSFYTLLCDVIADWDTRHLKYGTYSLNYDLFSHLIKWSPNKIRRAHKALINKGFIADLGNDSYSIIGFQLKDHFYKKGELFSFYDELKKTVGNHLKSNI